MIVLIMFAYKYLDIKFSRNLLEKKKKENTWLPYENMFYTAL